MSKCYTLKSDRRS